MLVEQRPILVRSEIYVKISFFFINVNVIKNGNTVFFTLLYSRIHK